MCIRDRLSSVHTSILYKNWNRKQTNCTIAVSYTHLDVYKRQDDNSAQFNRLNLLSLFVLQILLWKTGGGVRSMGNIALCTLCCGPGSPTLYVRCVDPTPSAYSRGWGQCNSLAEINGSQAVSTRHLDENTHNNIASYREARQCTRMVKFRPTPADGAVVV